MPPDGPGPDGDGPGPTASGDAPIRPETDRFLLDVMLGTLAVYLRMCGYDAAFAGDRGVEADDAVRSLAIEEDRRLLTATSTWRPAPTAPSCSPSATSPTSSESSTRPA